ncbi:CapA family protein [Mobilicoccus pelagius]|uniref:Capsule synthesis protein CapA domain-containing protein n=1 Tax=Mobilicoccus pelagius NBRC 104925 TaxID=1089455 RepID=H5UMH9_9MICO|nr:CapA family protein [Mobilicoccus pelagius]GAB46937.1 hypothetical protein MOPEL_001_00550 [Mobilicoccus pelagius NBRC 104925]
MTPAPATPAPASPGSATATEDASPQSENPDTISLAFAGDVHFARQVAALLGDSDATWTSRLPELAAADFAMVNLETAITERGRPAAKTYTFRAPAKALDKLAASGVDAVTMANNHAADYGRQGVEDTLAAIGKSPIPVVGFGADEKKAYEPLTVMVKGVRVGVIGSMEVPEETYANWSAGPDSPGVAQNVRRDRFTQAAKEAVAGHDLVVAFLHWGTEGSTCPNERQVETARILRDAGVDVIVGTHAHRPQGAGWNGRAFVGYGTGNFVWYNTSRESRSSGVLTLTVDAKAARERGDKEGEERTSGPSLVRAYTWTPKLISTGGVPERPTASAARLDRLAESARTCSGLAQGPE